MFSKNLIFQPGVTRGFSPVGLNDSRQEDHSFICAVIGFVRPGHGQALHLFLRGSRW